MNKLALFNILLISLILPVFSFSQIHPGIFGARPKEIDAVLNNPGIGFTTFQRFNGDSRSKIFRNKIVLRKFSCPETVKRNSKLPSL